MTKPEPEVREVDDAVLRDLASKYADVACPIHGGPPKFEVDAAGALVEVMCCGTLLSIVRELQAQDEDEGDEP